MPGSIRRYCVRSRKGSPDSAAHSRGERVAWLTKSCGHRMPASSTRCFAKRGVAVMPPGLQQALGPVLQQIAEMTLKIKRYDRQIQLLTQTEYPETQMLVKVQGDGHITARCQLVGSIQQAQPMLNLVLLRAASLLNLVRNVSIGRSRRRAVGMCEIATLRFPHSHPPRPRNFRTCSLRRS
jgi:hypothetical protein